MGAPKKLLVDNGEECCENSDYLEANEQYNIEVCVTGASLTWSNGIFKWNHAVVDLMVYMMLDESLKIKVNIALAHVFNTKNSLQNYNEYAAI